MILWKVMMVNKKFRVKGRLKGQTGLYKDGVLTGMGRKFFGTGKIFKLKFASKKQEARADKLQKQVDDGYLSILGELVDNETIRVFTVEMYRRDFDDYKARKAIQYKQQKKDEEFERENQNLVNTGHQRSGDLNLSKPFYVQGQINQTPFRKTGDVKPIKRMTERDKKIEDLAWNGLTVDEIVSFLSCDYDYSLTDGSVRYIANKFEIKIINSLLKNRLKRLMPYDWLDYWRGNQDTKIQELMEDQ